jgi:hypothetical protein
VFTYSKNLVGGAGSGYTCYDRRLTKALAGNDRKLQFVNQLNYALPVGRGCRFLTRGGILNLIVEGWTFLTIQSIRSGLPASFSSAGSPFKYLPGGPPHRGLPAAPGRIEEFVNDQSPSSSRQSSR